MMPPPGHDSVRYERRDVRVAGVFAFAVVFMIVGGFIHAILYLMFLWLSHDEKSRDPVPLPVAAEVKPPEPRLESFNGEALEQVRADENAHLNTYGWIDRKGGIVRIPIDRAVDIYLQKTNKAERNPPQPVEGADATLQR
jgi:hypothetical protein